VQDTPCACGDTLRGQSGFTFNFSADNLTGETGTTLSCSNSGIALTIGSAASGIIIEGNDYTLAGDNSNVTTGIFVNAANATIQNLKVTAMLNSGINIAGGIAGISVSGCEIYSNGESGINLFTSNDTDVSEFSFTDNIIHNNGQWGIQLAWGTDNSADDGYIADVELLRNTIYSNGTTTQGGIRFQRDDGNTSNAPMSPGPLTVSYNTIHSNSGPGSRIGDIDASTNSVLYDHNTVYENSENSTVGGAWFSNIVADTDWLFKVFKNTVYSNHTNGIDGRGIYFDEGCSYFEGYNNLSYDHVDNVVHADSFSAGIAVTEGLHGRLWGNVSHDNFVGILIDQANTIDILITNNTIVNNTHSQIRTGHSASAVDSSQITIRNNLMEDSLSTANDYGIYDYDGVHDPVEDHNSYYGFTDDDYQMTKDASSITNDPLLNVDFSIPIISPVVNAGTNPYSDGDGNIYSYNDILLFSDDVDKVVAPGGKIDIGAFEYPEPITIQGTGIGGVGLN